MAVSSLSKPTMAVSSSSSPRPPWPPLYNLRLLRCLPVTMALILFSFIEHSKYRAIDASFFSWKPPVFRRFTSCGIALDRSIAILFSSSCESRSRAHAAFSLAVQVLVLRARTRGLIASDAAMCSLFSSQSERFKIAMTPFSWSWESAKETNEINGFTAPALAILSHSIKPPIRTLTASNLPGWQADMSISSKCRIRAGLWPGP
jgi:hypothetical protein